MNDIRPPKKRPLGQRPDAPPRDELTRPQIDARPTSQPVDARLSVLQDEHDEAIATTVQKPKRLKKYLVGILAAIVVAVVAAGAAAYGWYQQQLAAVDPGSSQQIRVEVVSGMGPGAIAELLAEKQLIKNEWAFGWYVRQHGVEGKLQAGQYTLSKNMTVDELVSHLQKGQMDTFRITLYPGATLSDETEKSEKTKTDVVTILKRAGYSQDTIATALRKQYDHPVFAGKPQSADLEGYVYGETYEFNSTASVEDVLTRSFDEMYKVIKDNDLEAKYKKRGLTLYEGITLASIVQREVNGLADQQKVAGVFYNRLKQDMQLGSDVTYQYIADKTGQVRTPELDSPYNTRKYAGLPPGPIAVPGESALLAVAKPASHEYLFFLSGDDDKTYFGRTQAEHEKNIEQHCQQKCLIM